MSDTDALVGVQEPRILHMPTSVNPDLGGLGRQAVDLAALAGLYLDPWQEMFLENACLLRDDQYVNPYTGDTEHKWAAFEVGLTVSRQNGKGSVLEARELAGLFLFGERLIIHSAHQFDTSLEAFNRILFLLENTPDLEREVKRVSRGHGEEGIELKTGQRLRFRTRTKGGGRGFTGDCIILDECMYLDKSHIAALMPTMSARPNPQVWYTGSAGDEKSTHQGRVRHRALRGGEKRLLYAEYSAEVCSAMCLPTCREHDDPADPRVWAVANPAMGIRVSQEHIAAEFEAMDRETFCMERLSVGKYPAEEDGWAVIPREAWERRHDPESRLGDRFAIGVYTAPDRSMSCIVACGANQRGYRHLEIPGTAEFGDDHRPGIQWLLERIPQIVRNTRPAGVVIDPAGQAASIIPELEKEVRKIPGQEKFEVWSPSAREYAQSCGDVYTGVCPKKDELPNIVHLNQVPLARALGGAKTRKLAELWAWDAMGSTTDSSPICAATAALYGFLRAENVPAPVAPWVYRG